RPELLRLSRRRREAAGALVEQRDQALAGAAEERASELGLVHAVGELRELVGDHWQQLFKRAALARRLVDLVAEQLEKLRAGAHHDERLLHAVVGGDLRD